MSVLKTDSPKYQLVLLSFTKVAKWRLSPPRWCHCMTLNCSPRWKKT